MAMSYASDDPLAAVLGRRLWFDEEWPCRRAELSESPHRSLPICIGGSSPSARYVLPVHFLEGSVGTSLCG